ncbi:MAG: hypothetical protein AAGD23_10420 [Pseudomonadota bacterium]
MTDPRDTLMRRRKIRDRSMVLVLVGIALLMPPTIGVSLMDVRIAGLPAPLIYVFGVWALLILAAHLLAGPLGETDESSPAAEMPETDS